MSAAFFSTFRLITFQAAQNTVALDMANRIIKSLDCRKIILIFCILEVDFAISVITLFVVFNESFQKALVDKSVCVINIALLIVLPSTKNPLFDVTLTHCTSYRFALACYGGIFETLRTSCSDLFVCCEGIFETLRTLCIEVSACYEGISDFLCTPGIDICIFRVRKNISDNALFGFRSYLLFLFPFYKTQKFK